MASVVFKTVILSFVSSFSFPSWPFSFPILLSLPFSIISFYSLFSDLLFLFQIYILTFLFLCLSFVFNSSLYDTNLVVFFSDFALSVFFIFSDEFFFSDLKGKVLSMKNRSGDLLTCFFPLSERRHVSAIYIALMILHLVHNVTVSPALWKYGRSYSSSVMWMSLNDFDRVNK